MKKNLVSVEEREQKQKNATVPVEWAMKERVADGGDDLKLKKKELKKKKKDSCLQSTWKTRTRKNRRVKMYNVQK